MKIEDIEIKKINNNINPNRDKNEAKDGLSKLMQSIEQNGLLHPIGIVQKGNENICIFGHRRLEACKKLGYKSISCSIMDFEKMSEKDFLIINAVENLSRKDPTVFEIGSTIERLIEIGLNESEISIRLDLPKGRVKDCLRNYRLIPNEYKDKVVLKEEAKSRFDKSKLGLSTISKLGHISRNFSLTPKETKEMYDLAYKEELNIKQLNMLAAFLNEGLDKKEAISKLNDYSLFTINFAVNNKEFDKYKNDFSSFNKLVKYTILKLNKNLILHGKGN